MQSLDRLMSNIQATRAAASAIAPPTPFATAVLNTSLGDLIRDIDSAELGLFTPELKRVEFHRPAPRRKQDPEIYAQAALTYITRYAVVRPMPRAQAQATSLIEQLEEIRDRIRDLNDMLESGQPSEIKPLADQEEERVHQLQVKLENLKQRKAAATARARSMRPKTPDTRLESSQYGQTPRTPALGDELDEPFRTPARTLRFTENLMEEEVDFGDITVSSPTIPSLTAAQLQEDEDEQVEEEEEVSEELIQEASLADESTFQEVTIEDPVPIEDLPPIPEPVAETPRKNKLRINPEVERIVGKIWMAAGDLIMPGHSYDTSGTGTGPKPPRAKETITYLQEISSLTAAPASPSTTISDSATGGGASSGPTVQQILTAHLLFALLSSGPPFSMPLNHVKELLATKGSASGGASQNTTRILFGCVAKRLVKIERGGGEQTVKFDV